MDGMDGKEAMRISRLTWSKHLANIFWTLVWIMSTRLVSAQAVQQPATSNPPAEATRSSGASPQSVADGAIATQSANGVQPPFEPLSAAQQERIDGLLTYWERKSSAVKTYSCKFTRFEYDSVFGPQNPKWHKTQSKGIIRFGAPDKGEFHVTHVGNFQPPAKEGSAPTWPMASSSEAEHWICDGNSIYELNAAKKQLKETKLPEDLRGKQIADGPLPFMFGATKEKIEQKYWIRELLPPADRKGEYWLEAFPKLAENAVQFKKVMVILDEETFLPNALQIFPPNYDGHKNLTREVYLFTDRKTNDLLAHRGKQFFGQFISPRTPVGWKKIVEDYGTTPQGPAPQAPMTANTGIGTPASQPSAVQR